MPAEKVILGVERFKTVPYNREMSLEYRRKYFCNIRISFVNYRKRFCNS